MKRYCFLKNIMVFNFSYPGQLIDGTLKTLNHSVIRFTGHLQPRWKPATRKPLTGSHCDCRSQESQHDGAEGGSGKEGTSCFGYFMLLPPLGNRSV